MKTQKGITLIALIITIIVMLILVGVSVSVALNTGLFKTTQKATKQYEVAQEKESIGQTFIEWQFEDGKMSEYFKEEYGSDKVQANADESITVTMPSGNRYVVTEDGDITLSDKTEEGTEDGTEGETPEEPSEIPVASVTITGATTVNVGETTQLTATILPDNAINKNITWSSKNTGVATVDSIGKVTGISAGTATITATSNNNITGEYTIEVIEIVDDPLAGTWLFNDTISLDGTFSYFLDFTWDDNGIENQGCEIMCEVQDYGLGQTFYLNFGIYVGNSYNPIEYISMYDKYEINNLSGRTIDIYSKMSEVDGGTELLIWLQSNAVKQSS